MCVYVKTTATELFKVLSLKTPASYTLYDKHAHTHTRAYTTRRCYTRDVNRPRPLSRNEVCYVTRPRTSTIQAIT